MPRTVHCSYNILFSQDRSNNPNYLSSSHEEIESGLHWQDCYVFNHRIIIYSRILFPTSGNLKSSARPSLHNLTSKVFIRFLKQSQLGVRQVLSGMAPMSRILTQVCLASMESLVEFVEFKEDLYLSPMKMPRNASKGNYLRKVELSLVFLSWDPMVHTLLAWVWRSHAISKVFVDRPETFCHSEFAMNQPNFM